MENILIVPQQKFQVKIDGVYKIVYYIDAVPRTVLKVDGEHTYLWYRDPRITGPFVPKLKVRGVRHEIHETERISDRTDVP